MTRIVLHIDRLVLDGVDRSDAAAVADGLRRELRRLLSDPALTDGFAHSIDRLDLGRRPVANASGRSLGHALARAIVRGGAG